MRLAPGLGLALLAGLLLSSLSCRGQLQGLGVKLDLDHRTLSNGLTVLMLEDHTVPIISYQTWYRVGSVDERPGITGISHLFEHMMFKGTVKYGPKIFFQELESKGAEVNAFTTRDYTVYYEDFVPDLLEKVMEMEADRMVNLKIDADVLDNERLVVFEERRLRTENSPEGKMQEALWELAYREHPYQWPVIGSMEDLASLTLEQVTEYYKTHYQPANAALVIAGDFKADQVWPLVKKYYAGIPSRPQPKRDIPLEPEQEEERRLILRDATASERFAQSYHITAATDDDSFALDVLANILFEGTSSRAWRRLVEEKELVLAVGGSSYTPTYPGLFTISGTMKAGIPAAEAEKALETLIREVQDAEVSEKEIRTAVRQLTIQMLDSVRTPHGIAQLIGTVQMVLGNPKRYSEDLEKYLRVTAADVRRVARKYLIPNNRSVVLLAPPTKKTGGAR